MKRDPAFLKAVRALNCLACGKAPPNEAHHIRSRGAGGKDDFFNVISLCDRHHRGGPEAWHQIGAISFINKFPWVGVYMRQLGWTFVNNKLIPPKESFDLFDDFDLEPDSGIDY